MAAAAASAAAAAAAAAAAVTVVLQPASVDDNRCAPRSAQTRRPTVSVN